MIMEHVTGQIFTKLQIGDILVGGFDVFTIQNT